MGKKFTKADGEKFRCPSCGHEEFKKHEETTDASGMTVCAYECEHCYFISLFSKEHAPAPAKD